MRKSGKEVFVLWGGYIIASSILGLAGFYFSAIVGTILFGVCLAGAFILALGKDVAGLEKFEERHPFLAHTFELFGKADVVFSVLLLPWIGRAFAVSMGWQWAGFGAQYAEGVVLVMAFVWGVVLALAIGRFVLKKIVRR